MSILNFDKCSYYSSAVINNFEQVWIRLIVEYCWRPIFINYISAIQLILKLSQAYVDNEKIWEGKNSESLKGFWRFYNRYIS